MDVFPTDADEAMVINRISPVRICSLIGGMLLVNLVMYREWHLVAAGTVSVFKHYRNAQILALFLGGLLVPATAVSLWIVARPFLRNTCRQRTTRIAAIIPILLLLIVSFESSRAWEPYFADLVGDRIGVWWNNVLALAEWFICPIICVGETIWILSRSDPEEIPGKN